MAITKIAFSFHRRARQRYRLLPNDVIVGGWNSTMEKRMRSWMIVPLTAAAAISFAALQVQAAPWGGAANLADAAKATVVVENVACNGRWERCPPGSHWWRGACRPC